MSGPGGLAQQLREARLDAIYDRHAQGVPWTTVAREMGISIPRLGQLRQTSSKEKKQ